MSSAAVKAPPSTVEAVQSFFVNRFSRSLYRQVPEEGWLSAIKKEGSSEAGASTQGVVLGLQHPAFDMEVLEGFKDANEHHSTCLATKVSATTGLGFQDSRQITPATPTNPRIVEDVESEVDRTLDPLCDTSFQETLHDICEDYWENGVGYMEVVRNDSGQIIGLYHIQAQDVRVFLENHKYDFHYEITSEGITRRFARFGDLEDFKRRAQTGGGTVNFQLPSEQDDRVSEVIRFRFPTSSNRWYGRPDWLAAVPLIELAQCLHQYKYDYFLNRGVPEFMLFILGAKLKAKDWEKVETAIRANIGLGNTHKSMALNLSNPDIEVKLEKLASDGTVEDGFDTLKETLATSIVTAHRVPPLLAGILIPGKLGATNELPNAMMAFQTLVIGPHQRNFKQTLSNTLGNKKHNGGLTLNASHFRFRKITEEIDVGTMDTVSRMRQTVPEANQEGRDLSEGLKD